MPGRTGAGRDCRREQGGRGMTEDEVVDGITGSWMGEWAQQLCQLTPSGLCSLHGQE